MPVLRSTTVIAAPPRTVAGALRDHAVWRRCGCRVGGTGRWLAAGDEVRIGVLGIRLRVETVSPSGMRLVGRGVESAVGLVAVDGGTRMVDELHLPRPLPRAPFRRLLSTRATVLAEAARALAGAPVVVATALVRDAAVLAARRTRPPALAGLWELPGGRVEAGESEAAAVVRECREELGTEVVVDGPLATDLRIDAGVLRVHAAHLADGAPEPRALEHSGLRWVTAAEVPEVDWVPADRAVVTDLLDLLRSRSADR